MINSIIPNEITAMINGQNEEKLKLLYAMMLIRSFEDECAKLYKQGLIYGFCHLYAGQEAIATGIMAAMNDGDSTITSYRCHAHMLLCGTDPKMIFAELMGRRDGCSSGKGGSMHMFNVEKGFFGGNGIVGAQVPIGTGIAFANKYKKNNKICIVFMGDGATNQGQVFESYNMASLWNIPVLYIIENNMYALGTATKRACAGRELHERGAGFGIKSKKIDGMNVLDVFDESKTAIEDIRKTNRPYIIEVDTYRYYGHSVTDPATYRKKEDVELVKRTRDPIEKIKKALTDSEKEISINIEKFIKNKIDEASAEAQKSKISDMETLTKDVFLE